MAKYILKRLMYIVVVFVILSLLMFLIYNMVPYDRAATEAKAEVTANKRLNYEERYSYWQYKYGLDGNIFERYLRWVGVYPYTDYDFETKTTSPGRLNGLLQGNLGYSFMEKKDVSEIITTPMGNTVFINIFATILALGITIPLGIFCAVKKGSKRDVAVQVGTVVGYSLPLFIIAILFIWIFAVAIPIFPVSGFGTPGANFQPWTWSWFTDKMYYLSLPLIVMTFGSLGGMTRYVRAAMIESLSMDCIRTARAKGVREKTVIYSHAWRNALIPIVTVVIGWFLGIFSGSIMIENIFGLHGLGKLYITALNGNDYEVVLALQMFYVSISLFGNLLIDIIYGFVDPRIRVSK